MTILATADIAMRLMVFSSVFFVTDAMVANSSSSTIRSPLPLPSFRTVQLQVFHEEELAQLQLKVERASFVSFLKRRNDMNSMASESYPSPTNQILPDWSCLRLPALLQIVIAQNSLQSTGIPLF
mmetsp:Transcript_26720/g.50426  ORF Transcript_26720/g.50426 Transcript_26720/m.50426 type:complete len:125 (-) Transcript_26720:418-792(-)